MISFDLLTLKAFISEQKDFLTGARISKIQQPTRREFIITLRNFGENRVLYINIDPKYYHICFMSKNNLKKRILEIPQKPPMFCMQLRKYIESAKIIKVVQPENERIIELHVESSNNVGENIYPCLAIELMGKYSNVILYNSDTDIIIGCAHNVGIDKSRKREVYGGIPYIYPPKQPYIDTNKFKSLILEDDFKSYSNVNDLVDSYYAGQINQDKYNKLKKQYTTIVSQKLKKLSKTLMTMENKLTSNKDIDQYRLSGDLLMANLYCLKDFSKEVSLYDYENDKNIKLVLDETKTIKENASKFYKLYNKGKNARIKLTELISMQREEQEYLEQLLYSINICENIEDLSEVTPELEISKSTNGKQKDITNNITCIEKDNQTKIYIGKNNKQNDYIISKLASDEDLWFHVHNNAGSHVLLKTQNLTDDLILYCAKLAKEHSGVKNSSKIGVIYTKRKYLKKPPKAKLGYVTYRNEKEIILD